MEMVGAAAHDRHRLPSLSRARSKLLTGGWSLRGVWKKRPLVNSEVFSKVVFS